MIAQLTRLEFLLKSLYRDHDSGNGDGWYACPKSEEYLGERPESQRQCTCGAEESNKYLSEALEIVKNLKQGGEANAP